LEDLKKGWEESIKIDLKKMGFEDRRWVELAQDHAQLRNFVLTLLNPFYYHFIGQFVFTGVSMFHVDGIYISFV
jgi:hypothetical protein